ncbi:hypothetical protein [Sebaldella sp. S0638]|nr:hypothetical protein [Sebaldella sp. S0638]
MLKKIVEFFQSRRTDKKEREREREFVRRNKVWIIRYAEKPEKYF